VKQFTQSAEIYRSCAFSQVAQALTGMLQCREMFKEPNAPHSVTHHGSWPLILPGTANNIPSAVCGTPLAMGSERV